MNHASLVAPSRREDVQPTICPGELMPLATRRHWASGALEQIFHCEECRSILGVIGDTVQWSINETCWKGLG